MPLPTKPLETPANAQAVADAIGPYIESTVAITAEAYAALSVDEQNNGKTYFIY